MEEEGEEDNDEGEDESSVMEFFLSFSFQNSLTELVGEGLLSLWLSCEGMSTDRAFILMIYNHN